MARIGWRRAGGPLRLEEQPASMPRAHPTWIRACSTGRARSTWNSPMLGPGGRRDDHRRRPRDGANRV